MYWKICPPRIKTLAEAGILHPLRPERLPKGEAQVQSRGPKLPLERNTTDRSDRTKRVDKTDRTDKTGRTDRGNMIFI